MTGDDELMDALGRTARDRDLDPRWERLAAGELSDAELASLRADAGEEAAMLEAAFAPLDPADQEVFADAILGAGANAGGESIDDDAAKIAGVSAEGSGHAARERRDRARSGSRRRFRWGAGAVAIAAAVALLFWLPGATPTLPEYLATVQGGAQGERGPDDSAPQRFRAEDRVELRLRPTTDVSIPIHAALFRASEGAAAERLDLPLEVAATGAVRVTARASDLLPEPGEYRITIVVAPSRTPIDDVDLAGATRMSFSLVRADEL